MELQKSIVAILDQNNQIVGTGFVVGENRIVTCAHVVKLAGAGPGGMARVRFAVDKSERFGTVDADAFSPEDQDDVVLLRVSQTPGGAQILPLGNSRASVGKEFNAFGYAVIGKLQGIGARGQVISLVDGGRWLQLRSQEIDHGMSGGPAVDESQGAAVGMISWGKSAEWRRRNADTSLALSVETIRQHCKELPTPQPIANPFGERGRIEDAARYFVRQPVTREVFDELRKRQSVSVVGDTQSGKSSLLWYLTQMGPQALNRPPEDFAYVDLQLVRSEDEFFECLCEALGVAACRGFWFEKALRGRHIFLCLDEIEKMAWQGFTQEIRSELRGLADGSNAPLTLVIASRSPLARIFQDSAKMTSPLAGLCLQLSLPPFTLPEAIAFTRSRLEGTGHSLPDAAVETAWRASGGSAAALQKALHDVFETSKIL